MTPVFSTATIELMVSNAGQSFITRQFALGCCLRHELTLPALARLGLPIPLGGTSHHVRTPGPA
jgi:glycosyltransferase XagB